MKIILNNMYLKFAEYNTYIRVVRDKNTSQNLGYISRNGQLNAKPELFELLNKSVIKLNWIDGPGCHGGVNSYKHTNDFDSLFNVLIFLKDIAKEFNIEINFII